MAWKLQAALIDEVRRLRRLTRALMVVFALSGLFLVAVVAAGGYHIVAFGVGLATVVSTFLARNLIQRRYGQFVDRAGITVLWLASRGLLDGNGSLTGVGQARLEELTARHTSSVREAHDSAESLALSAYRESAALATSGGFWLGPLSDAYDYVEFADLHDDLARDAHSRSMTWWLIVGPLAVVGLSVLLLVVLGLLVRVP